MANPRVTFDFKADISQINQAIQKIDQRLDKFGSKAKQHTEGFAGGMAKFGLAVSGVQQAFGILNNTIGAVARKISDIGGNFEHTMNKVKAVSGASVAEFKKLRDSALEFGGSTAKSAQDVGKLQFELSKLGFKTDEILASTEGILNMAIAFDVDLARASEVAGGVLRQFSLDASEAGNVADMMAVAFSSTALDTEKFANAMVYVGQIAPQAGFEVHEVTALLGVLSNKMVDSSIAGTALTKIMEQMANANSDLAKEIGHPVTGMEGFVEVMTTMKREGKDLSDFLGFVLPRTAKTFGVLVDSAKDIDKLTKSLVDVEGASKKMADTMLDDLVGAQLLVVSATELLWIRIATELTPAFMDLKRAQIAFIQDIDTEELYAYSLGFSAVAVAIAWFNRVALVALFRLKAMKIALATSGWGLALVAIGAVVGAIIDATDAFEDETEALEDNTDAIERNKAMRDRLKTEAERLSRMSSIAELHLEREAQAELIESLRHRAVVERSVIKEVLKNREVMADPNALKLTWGLTVFTGALVDQEKVLGEQLLTTLHVKQKAYSLTGAIFENDKEIAKGLIAKYERELAYETSIHGLKRENQIKRIKGDLAEAQSDHNLAIDKMMSLKHLLNRDEVGLKLERQKTAERLAGAVASAELIQDQIDKLEVYIDTEKEATEWSAERLKAMEKMSKQEIIARQKVLTQVIAMSVRMELVDADKWGKKKIRLEQERLHERATILELQSFATTHAHELRLALEQDQSASASKLEKGRREQLAVIVAEEEALTNELLTINNFYAEEKAKIDAEKAEHEEEAQQDRIAMAEEMGFVLIGEEQRNFDVYIEFLDAKIQAEELYSERWFELMQHRRNKYDEWIEHQLETGRMSDVEHMALLSKQLQDDSLTVERRIELQGQLHQASIGFMQSGALTYKSYAKQKLVTFITEKQIWLLGKLAEIMATGATTLGLSLAFQLPMYAGAVAILEGAKSKVMAFEKGGLIQKPTLALMGEAGAELVIPEQGFKDYVKSQIIPFQAQQLGVPLSNFTNQNYINNSVNMTRQEELTEINTNAIEQMSDKIGMLTKVMNMPQGVTITDGSTIINADIERGRLN